MPMVCIIGANEVGKSTLLEALQMSSTEEIDEESGDVVPLNPLNLTRGEEIESDRVVVRVRYRLDAADLSVFTDLSGAPQLGAVRWLERRRLANGALRTFLAPEPVRDKRPRYSLAESLNQAREHLDWPDEDTSTGTPADPTTLEALTEQLLSSLKYINQGGGLEALADWLDDFGWHQGLIDDLRKVAEVERLPHPHDEAVAALLPRIPQLVEFDARERAMANEYDLIAVADDPPPPLRNLANLADLDLKNLREKIALDETGTVQDLIDDANAELKRQFAAWTQKPPVRVTFHPVGGTRLAIHVKSGRGASMRIGERSEGLRQFVALVALTAQQDRAVAPILLIDELEMHLHYDAQADLLGVLGEQRTAAQVIYTTHSAACLPEDLGSAVRVVEGVGEEMASRIRPQFWSDDAGLGSLLMAMGAASLAFVLLRPAAIVEGGGDLVLLPSLFREALEVDRIGFQVVPGGAIAPRARIAGLDVHGTATVWFLDGDEGGVARREVLISEGIDEDRILLLKTTRSPLELEDLIHPATYVAAVNRYASDVGSGDLVFTEEDLPTDTCQRPDVVTEWFARHSLQPPSKTAIANKVLSLRDEMPLVDARRKRTLVKLHAAATKLLDPEA